MKKLHITIALVLWSFAQVAEAQNMYRNYQSTAVQKPESAVSVVHSNGYIYYFQTDAASQRLSVTEINPFSMLPTGNNYYVPTSFGFVLNGVFEGFNGEMVLFGYDRNNSTWNWYPAVMVVNNDFSNSYLYVCNIIESPFVSGCSGYDINGEKIYALVADNGRLYTINVASPTLFREFTANSNPPFFDRYTDISWNAEQEMFVATGSAMPTNHDHLHPFVEMLRMDIPQEAQNPAIASSVFSYILDNIAYEKVTEHKALHVQISCDELLLYRDLQEDYNYLVHDIIWMTRINNYWNSSASISESYYYLLPDAKLTAKDLIYDFKNNRANLLCVFSHCVDGRTQLLAQADPYSLSSGLNVGQLGGAFVNTYCTSLQYPYANIYYTDLDMRNLAYNHYNACFPVLIAGVNGKGSVLTETYDISASSCDMPLEVIDIVGNPYIKPYPISNNFVNVTFLPYSFPPISDNVQINVICDEPTVCSRQYGGKSIQEPKNQEESIAKVVFEHNLQFFCEGFKGSVRYNLYDMAGKLLQEGIIQNEERKILNVSAGVYLLKTNDAVGNHVVKKIVRL